MMRAPEKTRGTYRGITRYRRDSRDKVSNDNFITVPLDNSVTKQMGQTGHGPFYKGIIEWVDNQFAQI